MNCLEKAPLCTIITPVFNGEAFLERYFEKINSLIQGEAIQIVIANDGSVDNTAEIIMRYAERDKRIVFLNNIKNAGVSCVRNQALNHALGKYILFFDVDDSFEPTIVEETTRFAEEHDFDLVCFGYYVGGIGEPITEHKMSYSAREYCDCPLELAKHSLGVTCEDIYQWLQNGQSPRERKELNGPWRMLYKRGFLEEEQIFFPEHLRVGEDTIFTNECLLSAKRVGILDRPLYHLCGHPLSTIAQYNKDPDRMVEGKKKLIKEKKLLEDRMRQRGIQGVSELWGGEYILSSVQLAWTFCQMKELSLSQKIRRVKDYHEDRNVQECWERIKPAKLLKSGSIKAVPLILFKLNWTALAVSLMNLYKSFGSIDV